jgi:iron(II)-dependent oxidoreductase
MASCSSGTDGNGTARISIKASPKSIPADGMSHSKITVTATGPEGAPLSGGEGVTVTTALGSFMNGMKEATLTPLGTTAECFLLAGTVFGVAALTATSPYGTASAEVEFIEVELPDAGLSPADGGSSPADGGSGCPPNCGEGDMIDVPAGKFMMGCNDEVESDCNTDEVPYHEVDLDAYKIDKFEVTVGQFRECVTKGGCSDIGDLRCIYSDEKKASNAVNCIIWASANDYCKSLGKRLPTEAEWEKAARGTDGRKYPWGNEPEPTCERAVMWVEEGAENVGCGEGGPAPVGKKPLGASFYGAMDMAGNVYEWVSDFYLRTYYTSSPSKNPTGPDLSEGEGPHVARGGAFNESETMGMLTYHRSTGPASTSASYLQIAHLGFRCAMDAK